MNLLINSALSAVVNLVLFVGIPGSAYWIYHRRRHGRTSLEIAQRAGLQIGKPRFLLLSIVVAALIAAVLIAIPLELDVFRRRGSPQKEFWGLGINGLSVSMAILYGMIKTGFAEEFFFRGLIAGFLFRRTSFVKANYYQATIFLLPHFLVLLYAPEMWPILPVVFVFALLSGWIRNQSGSVLGPAIIHGAGNTTLCLIVAARTAGMTLSVT
jgi:membrane protease YdiL (CAAX protease family)